MATKEADRSGTRLTIRISDELRAAIERCAAADRRTVSSWAVLALTDAAAAHEAGAKRKR